MKKRMPYLSGRINEIEFVSIINTNILTAFMNFNIFNLICLLLQNLPKFNLFVFELSGLGSQLNQSSIYFYIAMYVLFFFSVRAL